MSRQIRVRILAAASAIAIVFGISVRALRNGTMKSAAVGGVLLAGAGHGDRRACPVARALRARTAS